MARKTYTEEDRARVHIAVESARRAFIEAVKLAGGDL